MLLFILYIDNRGVNMKGELKKQLTMARNVENPNQKYKLYKKLYKQDPSNRVIKFEYAKICKKEDVDLSRRLFKQLLNCYRNDSVLLELGKMEKKQGNFNEAIKYFNELINKNDSEYALFELAKLQKELGNIKLAKQYFGKLTKYQNNHFALLELGRLEKKLGDIDLAKFYFKKIVDEKNDLFGLFELGKIEKQLGNVTVAKSYFIKLLNEYNNEYALYELGKLEKELGNFDEAIKYFNELLLTKYKAKGLIQLVYLYLKMNKIEDAYLYFGQLLFEYKRFKNNKKLIEELTRLNDYFNYLFGFEPNDINYFISQIYNYKQEKAIAHIGKHFNSDKDSKFNDDIDKKELYLFCQNNLSSRYFVDNDVADKYNFILPYEIGNIDDIKTNVIEVITILNTDKILTIYPVLRIYNEKYLIDIKIKTKT